MDLKKYIDAEVYKNKKLSFLKRRYFRLKEPSTNAVFLLRKMQYYKEKSEKASTALGRKIAFRKHQRYRIKLARRYGIYFAGNCNIGIGLRLPHPVGIIIGANEIGENVTIYQNVTIGSANIGDYKKHKQPSIGNDTVIFAGASVIGDISVADHTMIAAGAVLNKSTEENSIYGGVPAKMIKKRPMQ